MMNVFEPVRVKGKLFAKNVNTGEFAPKGLIRDVQLRNAEANREVLMVTSGGRVTRVPGAQAGVSVTPPAASKMSFLSVIESRDPQVMFGNLERLTKMVGRGIQPSLVITGMAGTGKTHLVKDCEKAMSSFTSKVVQPQQVSSSPYTRTPTRWWCLMTATLYSKTTMQ